MSQPNFFDEYELDQPESKMDLVDSLVSFGAFGKKTRVEVRSDIPYFINEYWTAGQRKSHSIHEISYRACFKAQLPEFFINRLTKIGDVVFDPFMGRGTTLVQAALMGRHTLGNDINPLSILLTRPRLMPITQQEVDTCLGQIDLSNGNVIRDDLLAFYHADTLAELEALREWLLAKAPLHSESSLDPTADWIRMVAINRLSGHSPGFFSGKSMPPNQAVSIKSQQRINEKLGVQPPKRNVLDIISKKTKSLLRDGSVPKNIKSSFFVGNAWHTPDIPAASVDLVVTSPPFLDVVDYAADNWLRCWFAGIDIEYIKIAAHKKIEAWVEMVHSVLREQARILKIGGHIAFEVGEVRNKTILLEELVWRAVDGLPFERIGVMVNEQTFTKTANCWGISNGAKGTNTNRIVILKRI